MQSAAKLAIDNRALILAVVRQRAIRPAELFNLLQHKSGIPEDQAKAALALLIESHEVELTSDRHLCLPRKMVES
jgi:hypothetical protein